jgi:hypothetical protein
MFFQRHTQSPPTLLHARVKATLQRSERNRLHEHSQVRPLAMPHFCIDEHKQSDRRPEEFEVTGNLFEPAFAIGPGNTDARACDIGSDRSAW